jgi:hypothetical protein
LLVTACTSIPTPDTSESLLAVPPPDWQLIYQLNNVTARLSEFVPPDETVSDWTTKLTFESFQEIASTDPIQALLIEVEQDKTRCNFVQHFNLYSGLENNYPSSVRLFLCGKNTDTGDGRVKMIKVIQGNDYLYVITLIKKVEPFELNQPEFAEKEIAGWSTYLRSISLCDGEYAEHVCPGPD